MIGKGSFGQIFLCKDIKNHKTFAIKIEKIDNKNNSMTVREIKVLMDMKNEKGFANCY